MRVAKCLICFVFICVTLLFLNNTYAAQAEGIDTSYLFFNWPDMRSDESYVTENDGRLTKLLMKNNFKCGFTCNKSGLYAFSSYDSDTNVGDHKYELLETYTDSSGQQKTGYLTIPAKKSESSDKYYLYCPKEAGSKTNAVVWLLAGHTYWLYNNQGNSRITINYLEDGDSINGITVDLENTYITGISTRNRTNHDYRSTDNDQKTDLNQYPRIATIEDTSQIVQPETETAVSTDDESNPFEFALVRLLLAVGDFFVRLMDSVVGENVTVTKLVYNKVNATNANFFDSSAKGSGFGGLGIYDAINTWYQYFKTLAIGFYIICLLSIGIHVLLNSTASGMQKARELLVQWAKGVAILFLMPIAMRWVFKMNEAMIKMVQNDAFMESSSIGTSFSQTSEWSKEEIEFRSPQYISKYTGKITFGTDDANKSYMKKIQSYRQDLDLMRVMRAYAGATAKIGYTLLWYVLIGQLIVFIFLYYKRYFMIAFLIAVFPVTCIFNAISIMQGKRGPQMSTWFKELLTNVFTQFFHAVIYTVITGIIVQIIKDSISGVNAGGVNWVIIIVSINFVPEGEKIIKKIISSIGGGSTGPNLQGSAGGLKGMVHNATGNIKQIMGGFKKD